MKTKYLVINSFLILVGLVILLVGIILSLQSKEDNNILSMILINLGTATIAGGISAVISTLLITDQEKGTSDIYDWKITNIYWNRSEMNTTCDFELDNCKESVDFVAFGLKSFRSAVGKVVEDKLAHGIKVRILTIDPKSIFLAQKEIEEDSQEGSLAREIEGLIEWVHQLKATNANYNIEIRKYDGLPQFSYQRIDNSIFIGPNLYGKISQKCITYKYESGGKGFDYFSKYYEELWNNDKYATPA